VKDKFQKEVILFSDLVSGLGSISPINISLYAYIAEYEKCKSVNL